MPDFSIRSSQEEIMDDLACQGEVVHQTLRELEFINRTLGGNAVTIGGLKKLLNHVPKGESISIWDLGCGGGDMLQRIQNKFHDHKLTLHGVDANAAIVAFAQKHIAEPNITFSATNILEDYFRQQTFHIATATLFLHHFTSQQLATILRTLYQQVSVGIVINDLHRHPLAYYSIKGLTQIFSKSSMVKFDAPVSVLRGFSKKEWQQILHDAGITHYELKWEWAFRWRIVIWK